VRGVDNVSNATPGGERRQPCRSNNNNNNFDSDRGVMRVYDSLTSDFRSLPQSLSSLTTTSLGTATYVCGPTVYDSAHLGHGRTYVLLDIMRRVLNRVHEIHSVNDSNHRRPRPLYVVNITDVDDKIIKRSREDGIANPLHLARYYENEFWEDMNALNVLRPDVICRVSEHVESTIVPYIEQIVQGGIAYVIPDVVDDDDIFNSDEQNGDSGERRHPQHWGSVYFDVRAFETRAGGRTRYGKLAPDIVSSSSLVSSSSSLPQSSSFFSWNKNGNEDDIEQIIEIPGNGGDTVMLVRTRKGKRDSRDFCLWKYRPRTRTTTRRISVDDIIDEDDVIEPPSVSYLSPWGPGRPGWHVECSAMIEQLSREFCHTHVFGMHAGGVDLKFPHHTNEIAQAEAYRYAATTAATPVAGDDSVDDTCVKNDNEWINHWVHTGHLYVKGRKMSKSLKNFITIREMLSSGTDDGLYQQSSNDAWHSKSDDFRLWCLGLSGSYRGPATFSSDRMEEARNIRMEWVRFLMDGQECLVRLQKSSCIVNDCDGDAIIEKNHKTSTRLWGDEELQLFHSVTRSDIACREALLDDLNGSTFVREISRIVDIGLAYVEGARRDNDVGNDRNRPEEPLQFVLDTLRDLLGLVGFTPRTVNAGISLSLSTNDAKQQNHDGIVSNTALVDEVVAFRSAVRSAALGVIRKKKEEGDSSAGLDAAKKILVLCDDLRDYILPKFGLEVLDNKVSTEDDNLASKQGWRHGSPRGPASTNKR
jgi:cysteinyl-tRNA synthetase